MPNCLGAALVAQLHYTVCGQVSQITSSSNWVGLVQIFGKRVFQRFKTIVKIAVHRLHRLSKADLDRFDFLVRGGEDLIRTTQYYTIPLISHFFYTGQIFEE